jgi:hypothetical protein
MRKACTEDIGTHQTTIEEDVSETVEKPDVVQASTVLSVNEPGG